jgi:hypothetical protein
LAKILRSPRFVASEAGLKFRPIGIISTPPGSFMIQPTHVATQRSARNSKNLRSLSLILVRFLINKTDVPFHCTCEREIAAII